MQKSFDDLDYELFFEDIGTKPRKKPAADEQIRAQNAYDKTPCLSTEQILQLSQDLKNLAAERGLKELKNEPNA